MAAAVDVFGDSLSLRFVCFANKPAMGFGFNFFDLSIVMFNKVHVFALHKHSIAE